MIEEWRPIEGYEGLYEVSSYGRVRSLDRYVKYSNGRIHLYKGKVLSPIKDTDGYLKVNLYCNGKNKKCLVHRLISQAFIPNPLGLPQVNHRDEDKSNNSIDNPEWCTAKYNINYGTARIRSRDTKIKNGYWTGLSREEYLKEYYEENKDKNRDKRKEYMKKYNQDRKESMKKYYQENRDKIRDKHRSYYQENKDRICEQQKEYRRKKKEEIQNNVH